MAGFVDRIMRETGERSGRATFGELFFDLVYVFAITQLSHHLIEHLTLRGAVETVVLLLAVWWAWIYTTWITNWFDPQAVPVRIALYVVMLLCFLMAISIPDAFGDKGSWFVATYLAVQIGRSALAALAVGRNHWLSMNLLRLTIWFLPGAIFWIWGAFAEGDARILMWLIALGFDYLGPLCRVWVPGLGASTMDEWRVSGEHMSERCALFVILALGESIILTGATFPALDPDGRQIVAFVGAFIGTVAFWWVYFDREAMEGAEMIEHASETGRLARSAYSYFHLPIVAGIILLAVADELGVAHPDYEAEPRDVLVFVGGGILFLLGNALFRYAIDRRVLTSRLAAAAALAILGVWTLIYPMTRLTLGLLVMTIVLITAITTTWSRTHERAPATVDR